MLDTFKTLTGCDNDTLAQYYIDKAKSEIKTYTKRNDHTIESALSIQVIELAVCYYNKKGAEGLKSQSFGGISESYINGIPNNIKTVLNKYRYFTKEEEL